MKTSKGRQRAGGARLPGRFSLYMAEISNCNKSCDLTHEHDVILYFRLLLVKDCGYPDYFKAENSSEQPVNATDQLFQAS